MRTLEMRHTMSLTFPSPAYVDYQPLGYNLCSDHAKVLHCPEIDVPHLNARQIIQTFATFQINLEVDEIIAKPNGPSSFSKKKNRIYSCYFIKCVDMHAST